MYKSSIVIFLSYFLGIVIRMFNIKSHLHILCIFLCGVITVGCSPTRLISSHPISGSLTSNVGASYYIHFGPLGLCTLRANWSHIEDGTIDLQFQDRLVAIRGGSDELETLVQISELNKGTTDWRDDELEITITVESDGIGDDTNTEVLPLYEASVGLGGLTTENTGRDLFVQKIEYLGGASTPTAIINDSRVPMSATGFFTNLSSGVSGFQGGDAPDCVHGSNLDDIIRTRGGNDYVRAKGGDDLLSGGPGDDTLLGGADDDTLFGGGGIDLLQGESGDDCHSGGQDGLRDVLDDSIGANSYVEEIGFILFLSGNIELITEGVTPFTRILSEDCL